MSPQFDAERARQLDKLFTDVYVGRDADNPPVTMRLDRIERTYSKILAISTAILITLVTEVIRGFIAHH